MSKQMPETISFEQFVERVEAEKALLERHYCNTFKFWRTCPLSRCRKARACSGDANLCLKRRGPEVPREVQWQARRDVLRSKPPNFDTPERAVRELMPYDLVNVTRPNLHALPRKRESRRSP
jgi:hypothetical protein